MIKRALALALFVSALFAEQSEVRLSKAYGVNYLPLTVIEERKLIEKHAKAAGLGNVTTQWITFGSGANGNDALITGRVDFVSGGVAPFLRLWDKTKGKVKGFVALDQALYYFNTNNPSLKTLRDIGKDDRIAVSAVKSSFQAVLLQMASAKEFGVKNYDKFDVKTVSLKQPDALIALTSGAKDITVHIATEPFNTLEVKSPLVHRFLTSREIVGDLHTNLMVWTSEDFYVKNPKLAKAVYAAFEEAIDWINANQSEAAELYIKATKTNEPKELIYGVIASDDLRFSIKPSENITLFSDFLFETGAIKSKATSWKELFFEINH
ncbi:MAG: ABC transporter substrate-binding protein [Helicobacteraceae bacterium]|jgi:NitT/TauT family transport system substrate-binding protein|nr:ABC transporter substrate-binding protein [Helicobacteraceae bacterium]